MRCWIAVAMIAIAAGCSGDDRMLVAVNAPTADRFMLEGYVRTVVGRLP